MIGVRSTQRRPGVDSWALAAAGIIATVAIAGTVLAVAGSHGLPARLCALATQAGLLVLFQWRSVTRTGSWFTCGPIVGVAWFVLFTVPSLIYAIDPSEIHLPGDNAGLVLDTLQLVNLGMAATLIGWWLGVRKAPPPRRHGGGLIKGPLEARRSRCLITAAVGLLATAFLIEHGGGLSSYLSNLDKTASTNAGLTYVFGVAMLLKFAAGMPLISAWSQSRRTSWRELAGFCLTVTALGFVLGSRGAIVIAFLEWLILRSLQLKPPDARKLLPILLIGSIVVVFGLGAFKRYESFKTQNPGTKVTLGHYLVSYAPEQVVDAYADNYVDTVRLMGMARQLVPSQAAYEPAYQILNTLLHPIPSFLRPSIHRNAKLTAAFQPGGGDAYAVPLMAGFYLGFGALGILLVSLAIGWAAGWIDRLLLQRERTAAGAVALVCSIVGITLVMRSGTPNGLAFAVIDVAGGVATAWFVMKPVAAV